MAIDRELLGKSIRQVRALRGLSQAALARSAGIQGNSLALIERGERGISIETLNALAGVLKVPTACLTLMGTSKIAGDAESKSLVSTMKKLILATVTAQQTIATKEKSRRAPSHSAKASVSRLAQKRPASKKKASATSRAGSVKKLEHA